MCVHNPDSITPDVITPVSNAYHQRQFSERAEGHREEEEAVGQITSLNIMSV